MAKGVYNKKRPTAKKVSNYDTKMILIASLAFLAVIAVIVAVIVIDASAKSYVGTVDGTRIELFDYKLFLADAKAEMEEEASKESGYEASKYWTEAKIKEAEDKALDEVREFYAEYLIAKKNGFALSKKERTTLQTNLVNTIQYYHNYYYTSTSLDDLTGYVTGVDIGYDDINSYVKYYAKQQAISDYKTELMDGFEVDHLKYIDEDTEKVVSTGEQAIKDEYEKNRDTYRRIDLTTLAIAKSLTKPTEPTKVEKPAVPETSDETSAEWVQYKTDLDKYNNYVGDKQKYDDDLAKYEDELAVLKTKVTAIYQSLLETGKYTGKGVKEVVETEDKDEDGNAIKVVADYTDATLEDIIEKEGELYASDKGANTFYGEPDSTNLLAVFAHSIEWTDSAKTAVESTLVEQWADKGEEAGDGENEDGEGIENAWKEYGNDYVLESVTENGKFKETKLKLLEDGSRFYIVKCTGILDLENSTEPAPSEDEADENTILSVRAVVIRVLKYATVDDDVKIMVKDAGTKYEVKGRKDKNIAGVAKEIFASSAS